MRLRRETTAAATEAGPRENGETTNERRLLRQLVIGCSYFHCTGTGVINQSRSYSAAASTGAGAGFAAFFALCFLGGGLAVTPCPGGGLTGAG